MLVNQANAFFLPTSYGREQVCIVNKEEDHHNINRHKVLLIALQVHIMYAVGLDHTLVPWLD